MIRDEVLGDKGRALCVVARDLVARDIRQRPVDENDRAPALERVPQLRGTLGHRREHDAVDRSLTDRLQRRCVAIARGHPHRRAQPELIELVAEGREQLRIERVLEVRDDDADGVRPPGAHASRRVIGRVSDRLDRCEHSIPCVLADGRVAGQHSGDGRLRDTCRLRDIATGRHPTPLADLLSVLHDSMYTYTID